MKTLRSFFNLYKYSLGVLFVVVVVQFIILQAGCILGSLDDLEYIFRPPKIDTFFQNYAILFGINILAWVIFRHLTYALFATTLSALIFAGAGIAKMYYLTDPILWNDIMNIDDCFIAIYPSLPTNSFVLAFLGVAFLIFIAYQINRLLPSPKLTKKTTFYLSAIGFFLFISGLLFCYPLPNYAQTLQASSPKRTYRYTGVPVVMASFLLKGVEVKEKPNYSKETIEDICKTILADYTPEKNDNTSQPNIVLIVQESMIDPLNLNIQLPLDPLSMTRHFDSTLQCVTPIAPTFGGGSWSTDFEMCSGFSSITFGENGQFAKTTGLHSAFPSIAHVLKQNHYQSHALIPCQQTLFSYKSQFHDLMGFEHYQDIEKLFPGIESMNETSDAKMYSYILDILHQQDSEPKLIYAQLLENHWPYKTKINQINEQTSPFKFAKAISNDFFEYLNRVQYSDKILAEFLKNVKNIQRPTLIYTFGDHVPPLSHPVQNHLKLTFSEKQLKNMKQIDSQLIIRRHGTVGIYWANDRKLTPIPDKMSHFFMSYYLFKDLHISHPFHTHFMKKMHHFFNALMADKHFLLTTGEIVKTLPPDAQKIYQMYDLILYDMCYGKQYAKNALFPEVKPPKEL